MPQTDLRVGAEALRRCYIAGVLLFYERANMWIRFDPASRILLEEDTAEDGRITEEAFRAATPIAQSVIKR